MKVTLGLDQGSSSSKALLLGENGKVHWRKSIAVRTNAVGPGLFEQDPSELWSSIETLIEEAKLHCASNDYELLGFGLSTQRSGVLAWKADGTPVNPMLTFRDSRTEDRIKALAEHKLLIEQETGIRCLAAYSGSKIALLQDKFPDEKILIGTLDTFLLFRMSQGKYFITEHSMAARSLLYSIKMCSWSDDLCSIFNVRKERLAQITSSLPTDIVCNGLPLLAYTGDAQAALVNVLDHNCKSVLNLGTISSVCIVTNEHVLGLRGFASSILYYDQQPRYLLEGITAASGAVINFLQEELGVIQFASDLSNFDEPGYIPKLLAYLPIHGTATPDWRNDLPNKFSRDINNLDNKAITAAALYSIGSFISRNILALQKCGLLGGGKQEVLRVSGGLAESKMLLQYISSVTNMPIGIMESKDGSAGGIATLAHRALDPVYSKPETTFTTVIYPDNQVPAKSYYGKWLELERSVIEANGSK